MIQHYEDFYQRLNNYATITQEAKKSLENLASVKIITKNTHLSTLYESQRKIGFVLSGVIRSFYLDENGNEHNKNFFTKNNFFMTSLDENPDSSVSIQSITECCVLMIDYSAYINLSSQHNCLEHALNAILIEYMTQKQHREIELLSLDAKKRYMKFVNDNPTLETILPQYHIASYLGITPTQLSRIRKNQHM